MNPWQKQRSKNNWSGGYVEWTDRDRAYLSIVFSWQLQQAYQRAVWLRQMGYKVFAGGPAVDIQPDFLAGVAIQSFKVDVLERHNPDATFTSRGCVRRCKFCAVPTIEGDLVELTDWEPKPIVCDNNLLACSKAHFDKVIDKLKPIKNVDFNQGLDARLLTKHHAERLVELDLKVIRLAWDDTRMEKRVLSAFQKLTSAGISKRKIRVYVLMGFDDTPQDALYRLETVRRLGAWPNPMRYQPLRARCRNEYVSAGWTDRELKHYMRYWSNLRHVGNIPFEEFRSS